MTSQPHESDQPTLWVLSLRTYHAKRIYAGNKHYEFRRVHASIKAGDLVCIYESGGVGKITGEFFVDEVVHGTPDEVVLLEWNLRSRQDGWCYLKGAKRATALKVRDARRYEFPAELWEVGVDRAPQSYCRGR